jgi:hypothetical protein
VRAVSTDLDGISNERYSDWDDYLSLTTIGGNIGVLSFAKSEVSVEEGVKDVVVTVTRTTGKLGFITCVLSLTAPDDVSAILGPTESSLEIESPSVTEDNNRHAVSFKFLSGKSIQSNKVNYDGLGTKDGARWEVAAIIDGTSNEWRYDASWWTNSDIFDDGNQKKTKYFNTAKSNQIKISYETGCTKDFEYTHNLNIPLREIFAGEQKQNYGPGSTVWRGLACSGSFAWQHYCNRQGFNIVSDSGDKIRFGIFMNNNNDCSSIDTSIGIGNTMGNIYAGSYYSCCQNGGTTSSFRVRAVVSVWVTNTMVEAATFASDIGPKEINDMQQSTDQTAVNFFSTTSPAGGLKLINTMVLDDGSSIQNANREWTADLHVKATVQRASDACLVGPNTGASRHVQVNSAGVVGLKDAGGVWRPSSLTLSTGVWHRLTVTARNKLSLSETEVTHGHPTRSNPPYTRFYLDGAFVDEIPYAVEASIYTIGSAHNNNEEWGSMSDVHIYHVALTHTEILSLVNIRNPLVKRRLLTMRNKELFQAMIVHMPSDDVCEPLHPKISLHLLDLEPTILFVESNGVSVDVIQHDVRVVDDYDSGRIGFDSNVVVLSSRVISEAANFRLELTRWGGSSGDVVTKWWVEGLEHGMGRTARTSEGADKQIDPKDVDIISGTVTIFDGQTQAFINIPVNHDAQ